MPPGEIPNPSLDARVRAKDVEKVKEQIEFQTTADKILGLLLDEPITIKLTPEVSMQFYPPSDEQYIDLLCIKGEGGEYARNLQKSGITPDISDEDAEKRSPEIWGMVKSARDMLSSINTLLADLVVDKSFTADQFKRMPMTYKQIILKEISADHTKQIESARKFRKKR